MVLEEVVVTSRRRAESLHDVPIAVTAVSAEQLELRGAPDLMDLQRSTPSLTLQMSRGTNSTLTAFIRGVGQQDPSWGSEPGVGLYIDDVYIARPQGAVPDTLDLERIEVLRGPQGTLYGRNTIGGAVRYVTRRLGDESELTLRAEGGNYNERNGVAIGSVPVGDSLRIGAAPGLGFTQQVSGRVDTESYALFADLSFEATPDLNLYVSYGRGFKSGGFDTRGDAAACPATVEGYDPETVDSCELGLEANLFDDRLTLATAIFDQEYRNQQVTTQFAGPPPSFVVSVADNCGKSRIRGLEFETTALLTDRLSAILSTSYFDTEFIEYFTYDPVSGQLIDVAGLRNIRNTPEWMGFLGLAYRAPPGNAGELTVPGSASYRGDVNIFETPVPAIDQQAFTLYDTSFVWTSPNESWRPGIYGWSLADKRYRMGGYVFPGELFNKSLIGFYGAPRTIRASLQYRF